MYSRQTVPTRRPICHPPARPKTAIIPPRARVIVSNVYQYFVKEIAMFAHTVHSVYFKSLQDRVAKATRVSLGTVKAIIKDMDIAEQFEQTEEPKKICSLDIDNQNYDKIREKLVNLILKRSADSELNVFEALNFKGSMKALKKILHKMGFRRIVTVNGNVIFIESFHIRLKRIKYLEAVESFRADGRNFVYINELCVQILDNNITTKRIYRKRIKYNTLLAKSEPEMYVIVHSWSKHGPSGFLTFKYTEVINDYENWLRNLVIPNLPENSVIITSHTLQPYKYIYPSFNASIQELKHWMHCHSISLQEDITKAQLYDIIVQNKNDPKLNIGNQILFEHGHVLQSIPQYEHGFNPLDNLWPKSMVYLASIPEAKTEDLLMEEINTISPEEWAKILEQTILKENKTRARETAVDEWAEQLIVVSNYDSFDSDEESNEEIER